jgi:hypothetical protein
MTWYNMKSRCYNIKDKKYKFYGARGIEVCDRWLNSFQNFYEDMGPKPKGLTLERIDNNGDYDIDNCKWAKYIEQNRNYSKCFLTEDDVEEIRRLYATGQYTQRELAKMYNYDRGNIGHIVHFDIWKDKVFEYQGKDLF